MDQETKRDGLCSKPLRFPQQPWHFCFCYDDCHVIENFKHCSRRLERACVDDETVLLVSIQEPVVQRHILVHDRPEVLPAIYVVGAWTEGSIHVNHWVLEIQTLCTVRIDSSRIGRLKETRDFGRECNQSVNHQEKKLEINQSVNHQEKKLESNQSVNHQEKRKYWTREQSISEPPREKNSELESNQSVKHQEKKNCELESSQWVNHQEKKTSELESNQS